MRRQWPVLSLFPEPQPSILRRQWKGWRFRGALAEALHGAVTKAGLHNAVFVQKAACKRGRYRLTYNRDLGSLLTCAGASGNARHLIGQCVTAVELILSYLHKERNVCVGLTSEFLMMPWCRLSPEKHITVCIPVCKEERGIHSDVNPYNA